MLGEGEPERGEQKERDAPNDRAPDADPLQHHPHRRRAAGHRQRLRGGEATHVVFAQTELAQIEIEDQREHAPADVRKEVVEQEEADISAEVELATHVPE